ncbi:hypothetical protein ACHAPW_001713 [Verticillium nonalfalfae]
MSQLGPAPCVCDSPAGANSQKRRCSQCNGMFEAPAAIDHSRSDEPTVPVGPPRDNGASDCDASTASNVFSGPTLYQAASKTKGNRPGFERDAKPGFNRDSKPGFGPDDNLASAERGKSTVSAERMPCPRPTDSIVDGGGLTEPNLALHELVSRNVPNRHDAFYRALGIIVTTTGGSRNRTELSSEVTTSRRGVTCTSRQVTPVGSSCGSPTSAVREPASGGIAFGDPSTLAGVDVRVGMPLEYPNKEEFFRDLDDTLDE